MHDDSNSSLSNKNVFEIEKKINHDVQPKKGILIYSNVSNNNLNIEKSTSNNNRAKGLRISKTFEINRKTSNENPNNLGGIHEFLNIKNKSHIFDYDPNETLRRSSKFDNSRKNFKHKIREALDNNKTLMVMTIASVYALILSDLNTIFFSKGPVDIIFTILSTIVFLLFFCEFILFSIARDDYNFTFFFWMDFISLLSMIVNIEWIVYPTIIFISGWYNDDTSFTSPTMYRIMKSLSGAIRTTR